MVPEIRDLLNAVQSKMLDRDTRQVSWQLLVRLADEGSTDARKALAQIGREAKRRKAGAK